eukprot:TRINITY_DN5624_c1_g1_i1.p1 TRINITY_DN5624_c1_g1~~TRINITY_DN5624_c1_g1_i1.p1  ORF type:complete len:161 (-),score=21.45 TRINITY_DN5624_c1_g1_i1:1060-1542(-)
MGGHQILFWHDEWCGQSTLKSQFPCHFVLDRRQQAAIVENFQSVGGSIVWDYLFRRNLHDNEVIDLVRMLSLLEGVYFSVLRKDERLWKPDTKGQFSVKSLYNVLSGAIARMVDWRHFLDPCVPRSSGFLLGGEFAKDSYNGSIEKEKLYHCQWMPDVFK